MLVKRSLSDRNLPVDSDNEQEESAPRSHRKPGLRDCLIKKGHSEFMLSRKSNALSNSLTKLERSIAANKIVPQPSTAQTIAEEILSSDNRISSLVVNKR